VEIACTTKVQPREVVMVTPDNHPDRAGWLNELSRLKSLIPDYAIEKPILLRCC
jgi:hypothetical protein